MKSLMIAMAAAASLAGATFISAEASAKPGYGGPGGFKTGPMKPGGFKGGGVWKPPHKGHGHWGHGRWGHGHSGHGHWSGGHWGYGHGWGVARASWFASPIYVGSYAACDWVRIRTRHGWRWRPYC